MPKGRSRLLALAGFLVLAALPDAASAQPVSCAAADESFARQAEGLIATGIEAGRKQQNPGAPVLQHDPELARIARERACDMVQGRVPFSHTDARRQFIAGEMVRARFGRYGVIGENIMKLSEPMDRAGAHPVSAEEFARATVKAWMESPEHRVNILNPDFHASGVGVAMVNGEAIAAQVFYGPARPRGDKRK